MIIDIDLGRIVFQHCVLLVQEVDTYDWTMGIKIKREIALQNVYIYIGNDKDYRKNALCTGNPILEWSDSRSWTKSNF